MEQISDQKLRAGAEASHARRRDVSLLSPAERQRVALLKAVVNELPDELQLKIMKHWLADYPIVQLRLSRPEDLITVVAGLLGVSFFMDNASGIRPNIGLENKTFTGMGTAILAVYGIRIDATFRRRNAKVVAVLPPICSLKDPILHAEIHVKFSVSENGLRHCGTLAATAQGFQSLRSQMPKTQTFTLILDIHADSRMFNTTDLLNPTKSDFLEADYLDFDCLTGWHKFTTVKSEIGRLIEAAQAGKPPSTNFIKICYSNLPAVDRNVIVKDPRPIVQIDDRTAADVLKEASK